MSSNSGAFLDQFVRAIREVEPEISADQITDLLQLISCMSVAQQVTGRENPIAPPQEAPRPILPAPEIEKSDNGESEESGKDDPTAGLQKGKEFGGSNELKNETSFNERQNRGKATQHDVFTPPPPGKSGSSKTPLPATLLRTPVGRPLTNTLALGRALRPLHRKVPSRAQRIFDIEGTVDRAVLLQLSKVKTVIPVFQPAPRRWLALDVVIDAAATMAPWAETVDELCTLLQRTANFSSLRTWTLQTDMPPGQRPVLKARHGSSTEQQGASSPRELVQTPGSRLVVVLSDCTGRSWYDGSAFELLAAWGAQVSVALLQILPESLWRLTALPSLEAIVWSTSPGAANYRLPQRAIGTEAEPSFWDTEEEDASPAEDATSSAIRVPIPVITLNPRSLASWSRLVAGRLVGERLGSPVRAFNLIYDPSKFRLDGEFPLETGTQVTAPDPLAEFPEEVRAEILVARSGGFSPNSRRLRDYLSLWDNLTIPFIRAIRDSTLPLAGEAEVAEVLMSGLLSVRDRDSTTPLYCWAPGVQKLLRRRLNEGDRARLIRESTSWIRAHANSPRDSLALALDPLGTESLVLSEETLPFAILTADLMSELSPAFQARSEALRQRIEEHIAKPPPGLRLRRTLKRTANIEDRVTRSPLQAEYQLESLTTQTYSSRGPSRKELGPITHLEWSGSLLAASSEGRIDLWHLPTGTHGAVECAAGAPVALNREGTHAVIVNRNNLLEVVTLGNNGRIHSQGVPLEKPLDTVTTMAWGENDLLALVSGEELLILRLLENSSRARIEKSIQLTDSTRITALYFSEKGGTLFYGCQSGAVGFLTHSDISESSQQDSDLPLLPFTSSHGPVHSLGVSAAGDFLLSGHADGTITILSVVLGETLTELWNYYGLLESTFTSPVTSIHFSADERLVLARGEDGSVHFWNGDDWGPLTNWNLGQSNLKTGDSAWHSAETTLALVGRDGQTVQLWDVDLDRILPPANHIEPLAEVEEPREANRVQAVVVGLEEYLDPSIPNLKNARATAIRYIEALLERGVPGPKIQAFLSPLPAPGDDVFDFLEQAQVKFSLPPVSQMADLFSAFFPDKADVQVGLPPGTQIAELFSGVHRNSGCDTFMLFWIGRSVQRHDNESLLLADFSSGQNSCMGLKKLQAFCGTLAEKGLTNQGFFVDVVDIMHLGWVFEVTFLEGESQELSDYQQTTFKSSSYSSEDTFALSKRLLPLLRESKSWPPDFNQVADKLKSEDAIPALVIEQPQQHLPEDLSRPQRGLFGASILWVDDHPEKNREAVAEFERHGAQIVHTWSTSSALHRISKATFHAVITDLRRFENSADNPLAGYLLLESLRATGSNVPVALLTNNRWKDKVVEASQSGFTIVADKWEQLLPSLEEVLLQPRPAPPLQTSISNSFVELPERAKTRLSSFLLRLGIEFHLVSGLISRPESHIWAQVWARAGSQTDLMNLLVTLVHIVTESNYIQVFKTTPGRKRESLEVVARIIWPGRYDYSAMEVQGLIGECLRKRAVIWEPDVSRNLKYRAAERSTQAELCIPLLSHHGNWIHGVLNVEFDQKSSGPNVQVQWIQGLIAGNVFGRFTAFWDAIAEEAPASEEKGLFSKLNALLQTPIGTNVIDSRLVAELEELKKTLKPLNALPYGRYCLKAFHDQSNSFIQNDLFRAAIQFMASADDLKGLQKAIDYNGHIPIDPQSAREAGQVFYQMRPRSGASGPSVSLEVVISYPAAEVNWVRETLVPRLESDGVSLWYHDGARLIRGMYLESHIWGNLDFCDCHLIVTSSELDGSFGANFEIGYSSGIENKKIELQRGYHSVDTRPYVRFDFTPKALEASMRRLVKNLGIDDSVDDDGFLTARGIENYVAFDLRRRGFPDQRQIKGHLLLFKNKLQRTWLVVAGKTVYCLLDDDLTQEAQRLIQFRESVHKVGFEGADRTGKGDPVLDLGLNHRWFYSPELFPTPESLEEAINNLLKS